MRILFSWRLLKNLWTGFNRILVLRGIHGMNFYDPVIFLTLSERFRHQSAHMGN